METYEFLSDINEPTEIDNNQFYVLHDEGTYYVNKQEYETETQKDNSILDCLDNSHMLDVASEQYYIDANSTNSIINDQLILPKSSYTDDYILQSIPQNDSSEVPPKITEDEQLNSLFFDDSSKIENTPTEDNCTEILLNSDQCQILEEKGYLFLEINSRCYLLNNIGLQDITDNEELMEKYKNELMQPNLKTTSICPTDLNNGDIYEGTSHSIVNVKSNNSEYLKPGLQYRNVLDTTYSNKLIFQKKEHTSTDVTNQKIVKCDTVLNVEDLPEKIFLGMTVTGKRMFAKRILKNKRCDTTTVPSNLQSNSKLSTNKICLQQNGEETVICDADDVKSAETIILQLIAMPDVKNLILNRDLLITKMVKKSQKHNKLLDNEVLQTLVTGRVEKFVEEKWQFVYMPDLMTKFLDKTYLSKLNCSESDAIRNNHNVLHIHVNESLDGDPSRAVVTVTKRNLPLNPSLLFQKRSLCKSCGGTFTSENALKKHQMNSCIKLNRCLITAVNPKTANDNVIIKKESRVTKIFVCMQCGMKFNRQNNFRRHLSVHNVKTNNDNNSDQTNRNVYKCSICSCCFNHGMTLTKHVVECHVKRDNTKSILYVSNS